MSLTRPSGPLGARTLGDPPRLGEGPQHISGPVAAAVRSLTVRHGPWSITYDPPPIPTRECDYAFVHEDFDASWEGEEAGYVGNGLCGRGASVEDCLRQISDIEAQRREAAE